MALATANEVMTQVPWLGETPRSPEMAGIDTLAIDVSSTFMNVASDSAIGADARACRRSAAAVPRWARWPVPARHGACAQRGW